MLDEEVALGNEVFATHDIERAGRVKAMRADDSQAVMFRTEAAANTALPHGS